MTAAVSRQEGLSNALEVETVDSHLHPVGSFDLADHPVPTGREEIWRFTPLKRLRGLHADAAFAPGATKVEVEAAPGVTVEHLGAERLPQPAVLRVLVVVQDHVLIHLLETQCQPLPKKSRARRTPATKRSTSSAVLYAANEARAVAATPNRRCSGMAQW